MVTKKVYSNSMNMGPHFNFKDDEENLKGGVHLDETTLSFASVKPPPASMTDSIHNYLVENNPEDVHTVNVDRNKWHLPEVQEAMRKELDNFTEFEVYDLVKDKGQHFILSGWVIMVKEKEGKWITKARLVIHGNQELNAVSPSAGPPSLRSRSSSQCLTSSGLDWFRKLSSIA